MPATAGHLALLGAWAASSWPRATLAKGVAGLGKAGGDGGGAGSDKAGQQVPPEVYNALTYAGSAFLLTLSVPLLLYALNKLLDKIEDCLGCGGWERRRRVRLARQLAADSGQLHKNLSLAGAAPDSKRQATAGHAHPAKKPARHEQVPQQDAPPISSSLNQFNYLEKQHRRARKQSPGQPHQQQLRRQPSVNQAAAHLSGGGPPPAALYRCYPQASRSPSTGGGFLE